MSSQPRSLCPWLVPHVNYLVKSEGFGLEFPKIDNLRSSKASVFGTVEMCDCFNVDLPYAEGTITWLVCFDGENPSTPPDFIFDLDSFEPDASTSPEFLQWNPDDPTKLTKILLEFLNHYKRYQLNLARQWDHLSTEIDLLELGVDSFFETTDFLVKTTGFDAGEATFVFECGFSMDQLSTDLLKIIYPASGNKSGVSTELMLSEELALYLGKDTIRPDRMEEDQTLVDYVLGVQDAVSEQISVISKLYQKRMRFIAGCLAYHQKMGDTNYAGYCQLLEFDSVNFRFISWLRVKNDFSYIASVEFPTSHVDSEKPTLLLNSVYHEKPFGRGTNIFQVKFALKEFDYENPTNVIPVLGGLIEQHVDEFQKESLRAGK